MEIATSVIAAGFRLGATMVPIVHFYGAREVEFILRQSGAKVLVTVDRFGHVDHLGGVRAERGERGRTRGANRAGDNRACAAVVAVWAVGRGERGTLKEMKAAGAAADVRWA